MSNAAFPWKEDQQQRSQTTRTILACETTSPAQRRLPAVDFAARAEHVRLQNCHMKPLASLCMGIDTGAHLALLLSLPCCWRAALSAQCEIGEWGLVRWR